MMKYNLAGLPGKIAAAFVWLIPVAVFGCQTIKAPEPLFTVRVRHLSDFVAYEDHVVRLNEPFLIADTDYSAEVKRFVPDFEMNMNTKEVISRSNKPLNPALQLAVYSQQDLLYETWVLYQNLVPHAIHEPGYYFQFISCENVEQPSIQKR
jgi:hypothetical protein